MKMGPAAFACLAVLIAPVGSRADAIDNLVKAQLEKQKIPGVALAVVRDGKVVKAAGYGLSNIEHSVPVKPETVFQSGSIGKQFAATAVMMLAEAGKIRLEDPIGRYLEGAPEAWKRITVRHLLTHTSGIKDYGPRDIDYRKDYTEPELLKLAVDLSLESQPGEKFRYCNRGYMLVGMIIRKASGQFYGDFLRDHVFKPLGMDTTRIITEEDIVMNRAAGYRLVRGTLKNQNWVAPKLNTTADGSLYLTVLDLTKWDAALYTEKLLTRASLEHMWTPARTNDGKSTHYGFGWRIGTVNGHRVIEHGGAWQGFKTHIARFIDDQLTVIVLSNLAGAKLDELVRAVAATQAPELADGRNTGDGNVGPP